MKAYQLFLISAMLLATAVLRGADEIILPGPGTEAVTLRIYAANSDTLISGELEEKNGGYIWLLNDGTECKVVSQKNTVAASAANEYRVSLKSAGDGHYLYRLKLTAAMPSGADDRWKYWNGAREFEMQVDTPMERQRFTDTFPMATVENGRGGLALAITPNCEFSSFASRALLANQEAELSISSKVVVDSAHPQELCFLAASFVPEFGWQNAVQDYYDRFPAAFLPRAGVDERLYDMGGYLGLWHQFNGHELHSRRYDRLSWEWSYAPWVKAGNWYPEENDDLEELYRNNNDRIGPLPRNAEGNVTWATYNRIWKEHFASADRRIAMFYYIYVNDIHRDILAQYPDARIHKADGTVMDGGSSSIETDRGKTGWAFPHGSKLQQYLERKIRLAAENYEISGFAFDMANNFIFDYSPAQLRNGRYRTFDSTGKICTGNFANPVLFADYIHTLKRDGRPMGTALNFGNMGITAPSAFAADAVMFEGNPADSLKQVLVERLLTGRKPLSFWGGVNNTEGYSPLDWASLRKSPETYTRVTAQMAQVELFYSLRYGIGMQTWAAVHPVIFPWIDTIIALRKLGWNPVSALHDSSRKLWIGRFGNGVQTVFTVLNPEREPVTAKLELVDSYLGNEMYIPIPDEGTLAVNVSEERSVFEVSLPPKGIRIFSVAAVRQPGDVTVSRDCAAGTLKSSASLAALSERDYAHRSYLPGDASKKSFTAVPGVIDKAAELPAELSPASWRELANRPALILGTQPARNSRNIADMFDWYMPFRLKNPVPAENVNYNAFDYPVIDSDVWRFTRGVSGDKQTGWRIAVGTPEELGWNSPFSPETAALPDQGLILLNKAEKLLWITGTTPKAVSASADSFFLKLDKLSL